MTNEHYCVMGGSGALPKLILNIKKMIFERNKRRIGCTSHQDRKPTTPKLNYK